MTRRHGEELETAIRTAVLSLLASAGPRGVTMESVAAAAKTSKPVLYRRWPDSRALLRDALLGAARTSIPNEDTGSYRTDMLAVLRGWAALFTAPQAAVEPEAAVGPVEDEVVEDAIVEDETVEDAKVEDAAIADAQDAEAAEEVAEADAKDDDKS
jgi:AcrR family transcriptional regulator